MEKHSKKTILPLNVLIISLLVLFPLGINAADGDISEKSPKKHSQLSFTDSHSSHDSHSPAGSQGEHSELELGKEVLHHLTNIEDIEVAWPVHTAHGWSWLTFSLDKLKFEIAGIDMSITKPVIFMWLGMLIIFLCFTIAFRGGKLLRSKFAHLLEVYILFIRDEVVYPNLGEKDGKRLLPFMLSIFFFILILNISGLVPFGHTATGNVNVTAGMAIIAFLFIQGMGIAQNGLGKWMKSFVPSGLPAFVVPIMIPVEIVGMFAKPFALCIRLFANMVAGHAVILVLLMLILVSKSYFIAPLPVFGVLFISCLELFVAHLQAFIFTILTTLFVSMTMHPSH
ncbi:MAG: F0F1 ATP synthase subunit A [Bacteroidetes bacterium]|nr:F0F1 ATP synthase subunit A [Bacteroidota bacterium]